MSPPVEGAVFFAAGSVLVFLGGVTRLLPWWRRENGVTRSMVALSAAILLLLAPSVLHYLFGWTVLSDVGFAWFVCAVVALMGVIHLWRYWAFRRIQREGAARARRAQGRKPDRDA